MMITEQYRATLEAELEQLGKRADEITARLSEVEFGSLHPSGDEGCAMDVFPANHQAVAFLAASFAKTLGDATNYMSIRVHDADAGWMEVVIQRVGKMTPVEGRQKAEAEVKRLVDVCRANGIDERARIDLAPAVASEEHAKHAPRNGGPDWIVLDFNKDPNDMLCRHCGTRQTMPERTTVSILKAMMATFEQDHKGCPAP